jgi:hypothetical protein
LNDAVSISLYSVDWCDDSWIRKNLEGS